MNEPPPSLTPEDIATQIAQPLPGVMELQRVIAARRAGKTPDAADMAALRALQPHEPDESFADLDSGQIIATLSSEDTTQAQAAWNLIVDLLDENFPWREVEKWDFPAPAREWLIKNWLPVGRIGLLTGEGEKGKSLLSLQLAATMASGGGLFLGRADDRDSPMPEVSSGVVVFANWEDEAEEARRRLNWIEAATCRADETRTLAERMESNLHYLEMAQAGPVWAAEGLTKTGHLLRSRCETLKARLLILDPLINAYGASENANEEAAHFMADWGGWAQKTGCTILVCHHPAKSDSRERQEGTDHGFRGASAFSAEARFFWQLTDKKVNGRTIDLLRCRKASYAVRQKDICLDKNEKTNWIWRVSETQSTNTQDHPHNSESSKIQGSSTDDPRRREVTNEV